MKVVAEHRRARFDYDIVETVEAGIVLTGQEVKSCRAGQVNLAGSYVSFLRGLPIIKQMKIAPYRYASGLDRYDPERDRPLLLKSSERRKLESVSAEKGMTVIPLKVLAGRFVKVLLGVGRGRKKLDKRHWLRERDVGRRMRRGEEV